MGMGTTNDRFGESVSLSGNSTLIGARGEESASGHAYVFVRNGTTWSLEADLVRQDAVIGARYGMAVSLSGDSAAVGAFGASPTGPNEGAVYVFVRNGTTWTQQAKLLANDRT